jgi:DNA-3-methyladenine glycosylase II
VIVNNNDIQALVSSHNLFLKIKDQYGIPPNWQRPQVFISLSKIILEQQVSLASAEAHFKKLSSYVKEFSPKEILKLSDEEMKTCQISRQKAKYLRELSNAIINKNLIFGDLPKFSVDDVRKKLTSIKGIGNWTTDIYLMFCLQSKDIFPLGDIALINTIKELTKVKTHSGIVRITQKWKPHRSLAAYFLWYYYLKKRNRV